MPGTHVIHTDAARGLLKLTFIGQWTDATFDAFEKELDASRVRMKAAGLSPDWPRVLIDVTDFPVQTKAVAARFVARVERFHADRRIALVGATGQLLQLQFRRIASIEAYRFFPDARSATAWLFDQGE